MCFSFPFSQVSVKIEDTRSLSTELNSFKRLNLLCSPLIDLTESHSSSESEQEPDKFTQYDPQIVTPLHATAAGLSHLPFLQRLDLLKGRGQSSPDESLQVESSRVIESKVRGGLEGNWELTGELLNAQLSQGLKISQHPATSSKTRSLVRTSPSSATGDSSASFFQGNISCSSERLGTQQANSVSFCITNRREHTADGRWDGSDSSDLADRLCCAAAAQSRLSAFDVDDMDHRSLSHQSDLDLEESSYFFWQDATYDEQYNEESRCESDPRSPSPNDAAFVCPAALGKLMSGQAQTLVREGVTLLCILALDDVNQLKSHVVFLPPCFYRVTGRMKTREQQLRFPTRA